MAERAPGRTPPAPGTNLLIVLLAVAIGGTVLLRAGRVQVATPTAAWPDMRLDVNTAPATEFNALPGIGPRLADRLAADRAARGPYASVEDLARVTGIGPKLVQKIRPYVVCGSRKETEETGGKQPGEKETGSNFSPEESR